MFALGPAKRNYRQRRTEAQAIPDRARDPKGEGALDFGQAARRVETNSFCQTRAENYQFAFLFNYCFDIVCDIVVYI